MTQKLEFENFLTGIEEMPVTGFVLDRSITVDYRFELDPALFRGVEMEGAYLAQTASGLRFGVLIESETLRVYPMETDDSFVVRDCNGEYAVRLYRRTEGERTVGLSFF